VPQPRRRREGDADVPATGAEPPTPGATASFRLEARSSSILPPAAEIERWEALAPGIAERIIAQFEAQGAHRRALERKDLEASIVLAKLGVLSAFVLALAALACAVVLVVAGHGGYGLIIGGFGIGSIVVAFIYGTRREERERIRKTRILMGQDPEA